ncbi:hypothetical protein AB1E18_018746 [Capra hircus]
MKPAVDEMFPEGARPYVDLDEAGGSTGLLMDLAANEKAVHADFLNDFEDLFDDDDIHFPILFRLQEFYLPVPLKEKKQSSETSHSVSSPSGELTKK